MGLGEKHESIDDPDVNVEEARESSGLGDAVREAMDRAGIDTGVYLSWRGLSVIAKQQVKESAPTFWNNLKVWKRPIKEEVTLLNSVSGYVKPHMMLLLLGPPGAGKTTLLETLAGKKPSKFTSGEILMNGKPVTDSFHRLFGYVTQEDILEPVLSVRETLQFSSTLRNHPSLSDEEKKRRVEESLKILSIDHVASTCVGGELLRGVSGGEKKRVSIGVELVKGPLVFLLDEPTTGLDSTSALSVIKNLRALADSGIPIICSLLQPSQELYEQFDHVLLLKDHSTAYFGPSNQVLPHFEKAGYSCPEDKNIAEFLLEICTPEGENDFRPQNDSPPDIPKFFTSSDAYEELGKKLWNSVEPSPEIVTHNPSPYEPFGSSLFTQMKECTKQSGKCLIRNKRILFSRIFRATVIGLLLGSLFLNMPLTSTGAENRISLLFFCITFTAMGAIASIPQILEERVLFYHQRSLHFYRTFAYFFASIIVDIPLSTVETVIFGTCVYWMTGLNPVDYGLRFLFFMLTLFITNLTSKQFCRATSASVPTMGLATSLAPAILCVWLVFAGFLLPRNSIPSYWIWMNWLAPFRYTFEALSLNELSDEKYCQDGLSSDCYISDGEELLTRYGLNTDYVWVYYNILIIFLFYFVFCGITFFALHKIKWTKSLTVQRSVEESKNEEPNETHSLLHQSQNYGNVNDAEEGEHLLKEQTGAHLAFESLSYSVPTNLNPINRVRCNIKYKQLLHSINGYVEPGQMVALMGASGAGKSTLLDVLAGRKTGGKTKGKILLNGKPKDEFFPRMSGYVEQFNVFIPTLTVRETVRFSAAMRISSNVSKKEREFRIDEALKMVGITGIQNAIVGTLETGISPEKRKRLSIAVELVSGPSILFLDEPTSGLDSQAAMNIMETVRDICSSGVPVICTIHQPSAALFDLFDRLLLMAKGGFVIYFGDTSKSLDYFSQLGLECQGRTNPADFVLECSMNARKPELDEEQGEFDPIESWNDSEAFENVKKYLNNVEEKSKHSRENAERFSSPYAVGLLRQALYCTGRSFKAKYRETTSNRTYLFIYVVMGLLLGSLYFSLDLDLAGSRSRVSLMYFVIVFSALGAIASIPNLVKQRAVYYREKPVFLRPLAYWFAIVLAEIPIAIIGTCIFGVILYSLVGLNWTEHGARFFTFLLAYSTTALASTCFAMMIAAIAPTTEVANSLVGMSLSIFSLFAGFIIPKNSIPGYWIWLHYISFFKYALESLCINELYGEKFSCSENVTVAIPKTNFTISVCPSYNGTEFLEDNFDMNVDWGTLWIDYSVIWGFIAGFLFVCYVGTRYISHLNR